MKYNHLRPVNEVYFGNTTELEEMLLQLHKVREIAIKDNSAYFVRINTDAELLKLNRMFEQFFGFKTFAIHIDQTRTFNACTIPISSRLDTPIIRAKHIEATSIGFRLKSSCKYSAMLWISSGLLKSETFTDREILAIMFHEIGHNFSSSASLSSCIFNLASKPISLLCILLGIFYIPADKGMTLFSSSDTLLTFYNKALDKIKQSNSELLYTLNIYFGMEGFFRDLIIEIKQALDIVITLVNPAFSILSKIGATIQNKLVQFIRNPLTIVRPILGREDERFADNFASLYGLGPDIARALTKMNDNGSGIEVLDVINNTGIIGSLYHCISMPAEFICGIFDEHPNIEARCYQQIKYMEKELAKENMDPKMKKQIEHDLKDLKSTVEKYLYTNEHSGVVARRMVAGIFYEMSGGDVRDLFHHQNKATSKNIDKLYNKTKVQESFNMFDKIDIK